MPIAAGVRQRDVRAGELVGRQRVVAGAGDELGERGDEVGEAQAAGVADDRHHQRVRAVALLDVDGDAEVDGAVVDARGLAVELGEVVGHDRHLVGRRARDREGDEVREGELVAGGLELVAARGEVRDGHRPERGRGRDLARLVHVAGEHGGAAAQRGSRAGGRGTARRRVARGASLSGRRRGGAAVGGAVRRRRGARLGLEHVGLRDAPGRAAAVDGAEIDALGRGDAARDGRDRRVVRGAAAVGGRAVAGRAAGGRRGRGAAVASGRRRVGALDGAPARIRAMTWPTVTVSPARRGSP